MNAYEEDENDDEVCNVAQHGMELKPTQENQITKQTFKDCTKMDNNYAIQKLDSKPIISRDEENLKREVNYEYDRCCQQCLDKPVVVLDTQYDLCTTNRDH